MDSSRVARWGPRCRRYRQTALIVPRDLQVRRAIWPEHSAVDALQSSHSSCWRWRDRTGIGPPTRLTRHPRRRPRPAQSTSVRHLGAAGSQRDCRWSEWFRAQRLLLLILRGYHPRSESWPDQGKFGWEPRCVADQTSCLVSVELPSQAPVWLR